jgi:hypothetical protein
MATVALGEPWSAPAPSRSCTLTLGTAVALRLPQLRYAEGCTRAGPASSIAGLRAVPASTWGITFSDWSNM